MKYKCIICGKEFEYGGLYDEPCPVCEWIPIHEDDVSDEDDYDEINHTTIRKARANYSQGLNIFGKPLKKI